MNCKINLVYNYQHKKCNRMEYRKVMSVQHMATAHKDLQNFDFSCLYTHAF